MGLFSISCWPSQYSLIQSLKYFFFYVIFILYCGTMLTFLFCSIFWCVFCNMSRIYSIDHVDSEPKLSHRVWRKIQWVLSENKFTTIYISRVCVWIINMHFPIMNRMYAPWQFSNSSSVSYLNFATTFVQKLHISY